MLVFSHIPPFNGRLMATVRVSPTEVQVNDIIYTFAEPEDADAFEACVAVVQLAYCENEYPAISKRQADQGESDAEES
jgi:hypothetical protein